MVDRITRRSQQCGRQPLLAGKVPEYDAEDVREVLSHPYRIIYRVLSDHVDVLAVVHGAQLLRPNLDELAKLPDADTPAEE